MTSSQPLNRAWRVAILGATGAVGRTFLECLERSDLPIAELRVLASPRSAGKRLRFRDRELEVKAVGPESFEGADLALCSAGAAVSEEWAPRILAAGAWVVDNSSRWRMDPSVPLLVPEVNGHNFPKDRSIIANPNCSTIQLVVALKPLDRAFGLTRVFVSTYQSASGAGQKGMRALEAELSTGTADTAVFPRQLMSNVVPQVDVLFADGWSREEVKMLEETRKILERPELPVHPTCVRVPVRIAHSEAVTVLLSRGVSRAELEEVFRSAPGVVWHEANDAYPTPLECAGDDAVHVGRLRLDRADPSVVHFWVVADNLRKGAALNAVQIAARLHRLEGNPPAA